MEAHLVPSSGGCEVQEPSAGLCEASCCEAPSAFSNKATSNITWPHPHDLIWSHLQMVPP
jgi:hypothetical protein